MGGEEGGETAMHMQILQLSGSTDGLGSARRAVGRRAGEGRVTVGVTGVTGDKCADCGLLIGTRTYIYNQWLKLEQSHLAKSTPPYQRHLKHAQWLI